MDDLVQIAPRAGSTSETGAAARPRVFVRTFGCQMNEYDTAKLLKILEPRYDAVDRPEEADLVIVNTCSVRDKPEQKLYSWIGQMRELKNAKPELLIGVGGCVAQQEGANIIKRSKAVDFVFGTHNLSLVPGLIDQRRNSGERQVAVDYRDEWEDLPLGLADGGRVAAFVSISRGCNKNCTYCIVPATRGPEVSRDPGEVEREARIAVHRGAKEIMLLGQTVNSYGRDLSPPLKFSDLLQRLSRIDGLERIRFISPHPQEVRDDFFELIAENPKICRHIHMPLQSGSDRILKAMNRNYRRDRYLKIIQGLREAAPDIGITTDVIVGFPGETREDFRATMEVLDQVRFQNSYSFAFSARPGTPAAALPDDVAHEEKLARLQEYQARQLQISQEDLSAWVGRRGAVLIDDHSGAGPLHGRLTQNIMVVIEESDHEISGQDKAVPDLRPGMTVQVEITEPLRYRLKGRVVHAASSMAA